MILFLYHLYVILIVFIINDIIFIILSLMISFLSLMISFLYHFIINDIILP